MSEALTDSLRFVGKAGHLSSKTIDEALEVLKDKTLPEDVQRVIWAFLGGIKQ